MCLGLRKKDFYFLCDASFSVDRGVTTCIVNIDDNFNPEEHFTELADGTRSNNFSKKRGLVISLSIEEGNLLR